MQLHRRVALSFSLFCSLAVSVAHADYSITDVVGAAKRGDEHAVHRLIADGVDLDSRGPMGYTALHWAAIRGHWRIFSELVAAGAPVAAVGSDGGTPLHWACHHDRPEMVAKLLDATDDLDIQNRWGRTPLHVASRRGCAGVVDLLLDRGADVNVTTGEGWTPLHVAYLSDHEAVIRTLLAHGADPAQRDETGLTPAAAHRQRPPAITTDPESLDEFEGIYDLGGGFSVKVWRQGDGLRIREFAPDDLLPVSPDTFFCRQEPWRVVFRRDSDHRIEGVEIHFLRRTVAATRTTTPRYVGSAVCMDCHSDMDNGNQYVRWLRSRHAHAYWRLGADWALFLARLRPHYQDLEAPMRDSRCRLCHVTGTQDETAFFAPGFRPEEGIGCESCHGPGSLYIDPEIMADRDAFLANAGRLPDQATCRSCHRNSENFDWVEAWPKIAHPVPDQGAS